MKNRTISKITEKQVIDAGMALTVVFLLLELFLKTGFYYKIALAMLAVNMIVPKIFYPFALLWFWLARFMGRYMNILIQAVVFVVLVTPVGVIRRLSGKDPLRLTGFRKGTSSVMVARDRLFTSTDIEKPY
jgi:hypothetical protein